MNSKPRPKTVDIDALVRKTIKPGLSISFWGTITMDPAKMRVSRSDGENALKALDSMVKRRQSKADAA